MVSVTVTGGKQPQRVPRNTIEPVTPADIAGLQESQHLDFKREINLDKPELKGRLIDDVVAFLNRGASRIIVGVVEKEGRFEAFRPIAGDADKTALRVQTFIQDNITPVPLDVQVVPIAEGDGFLLDIQIPGHQGGPFMNRINGGYLIRSGSRNLPIDPGMLRSRFIDERTWLARLEELTAAEDEAIAKGGRLASGQALRIAILPREHFDHMRAPFGASPGSGALERRPLATCLSAGACGRCASASRHPVPALSGNAALGGFADQARPCFWSRAHARDGDHRQGGMRATSG